MTLLALVINRFQAKPHNGSYEITLNLLYEKEEQKETYPFVGYRREE